TSTPSTTSIRKEPFLRRYYRFWSVAYSFALVFVLWAFVSGLVIGGFGIQGLLIEMLFIGVMALLIWQASRDEADQIVGNPNFPAQPGKGPGPFSALLLDELNSPGLGSREGPVRFFRLVLWGTGAGTLLVFIILVPLWRSEGFGFGSLLTGSLIGGV